jgi:hypothetical protein
MLNWFTTFGGMKLLEGYSIKQGSAIDATVWTIEKPGGLKISFEAGPSEGRWADPTHREIYGWYRTQVIDGHTALFAFIKPGVKTDWEPADNRGLPPGGILLVTFVLDQNHPDHTANFAAKVANPEELADALLMVVTFDPSKGIF